MSKHKECRECELSITEFKQITQAEIDILKEHIDVRDVCECCLIDVLGQLEYPN